MHSNAIFKVLCSEVKTKKYITQIQSINDSDQEKSYKRVHVWEEKLFVADFKNPEINVFPNHVDWLVQNKADIWKEFNPEKQQNDEGQCYSFRVNDPVRKQKNQIYKGFDLLEWEIIPMRNTIACMVITELLFWKFFWNGWNFSRILS